MAKIYSERLGPEIVQIRVGHPAREFHLHKKILTSQSPYFEGAFNEKHFIEGRTKSLEMPEDDPDVFELLVHWLYTNLLPDPEMQAASPAGIALVVKFFILADKILLADKVKTELMDCLTRAFCRAPWGGFPLWIMSTVLRETVQDCPIRQLVMDLTCQDLLNSTEDGDIYRKERIAITLASCSPFEAAEFAENLIVNDRNKGIRSDLYQVEIVCSKSVAAIKRYQTGFLALKVASDE